MTDALAHAPTEVWTLGDFRVLGVLGEGGSGTVYAAMFHGGEVALKVLRPELALSDRERARFLEEAERMGRVQHPGLITSLGSGVLGDGRPYICMPRLRGETLARRLTRGHLPVATAVELFEVMARAVGALHREGLIHRDLKPENIFLEAPSSNATDVPSPIVLDLGIARDVADQASTTTMSGQMRGTPAYMAPERFFGASANARSDIYELGVTLYMMLVGKMPWDKAESASARLSPVHPKDVGLELPAELVTVLLRALSTRPEVRPETADAFADTVRAAAIMPSLVSRTTASVSVAVRSDGLARDPAAPSRSRWPWVAAAAAALAVTVTAVRPSMRPAGAPPGAPVAGAGTAAAPAQQPGAPAPTVSSLPAVPHDPPTPSAVPAAVPSAVSTQPSPPSPRKPSLPAVQTQHAAPPAAPAAPSASAAREGPERYYIDRK